MEDVTLAHLFVQRVHALNGDPATGRPRNERLRSGAYGPLERPPLAPGLITRFPEVQDGIVAAEHGEAPIVMKHFEPQPIAVEIRNAPSPKLRGLGDILRTFRPPPRKPPSTRGFSLRADERT